MAHGAITELVRLDGMLRQEGHAIQGRGHHPYVEWS